jgi:hypothetical protein
LARRHLVAQARFKVDPDHILEEIFPPEFLRQSVVQSSGGIGRIFSTVIDENLASHGLPGLRRILIVPQDR